MARRRGRVGDRVQATVVLYISVELPMTVKEMRTDIQYDRDNLLGHVESILDEAEIVALDMGVDLSGMDRDILGVCDSNVRELID